MRVIFSTVGLFFAIHLANAGTFRGVSLNNSTAITNNDSHSNGARRLNTCNAQTPCTNPPACCSQWGFCGLSDSHCGIGCVSGCPTNEPPPSPPTSLPTTKSPTPLPTTKSPTSNPTNSPTNPVPVSPGSCPHNVFNKDVCCAEECGTCGGSGCGGRPGGAESCCSSAVRDSGNYCIDSDPPCIISDPPTKSPSQSPTSNPVTSSPTNFPTKSPSKSPTPLPTTKSPISNPTNSPTNPVPVSPGSCPHDVFNKDVCCAEECGTCGGSGCGGRPGGSESCCTSAVRDSGNYCIDSDPPCIISNSPTKSPSQAPTNEPTIATPSPTSSLAPTSPTDPPSNLVINPGFESASITPWYANSGTCSVDDTTKHSGSQSVLCKDRTATWMGVEQEMTSNGVVANAKYHVSCWVKLKNAASDTFKITFRIEDDDGPAWRGITRTISNEWTYVEGFLTVHDVTGSLSGVYMYLNGPGVGIEFWVDGVTVVFMNTLTSSPSNPPTNSPTKSPSQAPTNEPTIATPSPTSSLAPTSPTDPPSNLVINPGFESASITPWYANSGTCSVDDTTKHSGSQSVLCKDRTATWMGVEQEMTSNGVVANAKYHVSCWVKLKNAASDTFKITFRIEDDDGPAWRGITRTISNEWTYVEGFLTVQDVTGSLSGVYMYLNGPGVGIEFWVDGVTVVFMNTLTSSPSNPPTPLATPLPTNSPTTINRMLYCGVPSKCDALGGDEVVANMNDQHLVRCCSENAALNWPYKCLSIPGVFGQTNVPECYMNSTFTEAVEICSSYDGGRLCSGEEIKDKCTAGTGCSGNRLLTWGCTAIQNACVSDAECCTGLCSSGFCQDPTDPTTSQPTKIPTPLPTNTPTRNPSLKPTRHPTNKPTNASQYGTGPFVTVESSSEAVTIPRPPLPNLDEPRTNCPHEWPGLLSWHDPDTWGGQVPTNGDVTLPTNSKVIVSEELAGQFGVITVPSSSELIFDENENSPIKIKIGGMDVRGALRAGSETCRYLKDLTIVLYGSRPSDLNIQGQSSTATPTYKGISVNGGTISMHGKQFYKTWTRLSESVAVGQDYLLVQEQVNWRPGQELVLTTTAIHDSREWHQNEVMTIDYIVDSPAPGVGSAIHLTTPVAHAHIANNGYQAEVGLLSRNIVIKGSANSEPTDPAMGSCTDRSHHGSNIAPCPNKYKTGFGGHIMVHNGGKGYVEGVELYRMGQTNILGRYPFHFHNLGSDCTDCYFKENSIHKSFYRCISIHGTHGTTVSENVGYDVTGYCYYLEDGVEEDNVISFNLAAHIHPVSNIIANAGGGQTIPVFSQSKDLINPADVTASGYYLSNLHNDIIGNAASGGWSGFALPVLYSPIGAHKHVNMRPGNRLTKTFDGNTAHSTGWWWSHAGAIYSGGSLYYSSNYPTRLEYNAGRDQSMGNRSPCLTDYCVTSGGCGSYCFEGERAWYQLSNNKIFLTASPGLSSWSGGMEIHGFEAHDVELGLESLSAIGFGIDKFFVECRSGEDWAMPGNPNQVNANGFKWYDTNQEHIITNAHFKNCGSRKVENVYDTSPTRGCSTNSNNGCTSTSSVWGFVTHSDEHTPEVMQATRNVTYEDCGRRFRLYDYSDNNNPSSVSGRTQNWMDIDGTTSGLMEQTIIGSGLEDAGHWFRVEDDVVYDPEGPLYFIKKDNGPERSLGHIRLRFDDALYNSVGKTRCMNGPKGTKQNNAHTLCPTIGRIRHLGPLFDSSNDSTGGLPITANAIVSGPTGGFGWLLNLDAGPPKSLRIDQIEIQDVVSPLILAITYPQGTGFTIQAKVPWCTPSLTHTCTEQFTPASSVAEVRYSQGNKYFYDNATSLLYVRIIMAPQTYTGDNLYSPTANWHMWDMNDLNNKQYDKRVHALDRYFFNDITLAKYNTASYLQIEADCNPNSTSNYCSTTPTYIEPQVCPQGYVQVAYDKCCASAGSSNCHDFTAPPTQNPTSPPTFGANSNLFYNPSFEDGSLTPWYANGGTLQLENGIKHGSGTSSVLCKGRTATWQGVEQDMLAGGGRFAAGNTYHVSFWAKLKNTSSATVKITMKASYNNGSPVYSGISKNLNNYSWNLIEGDVILDGSGTLTEAKLYVNGPPSGVEFWVDDLSAVLV